MQNDLDSNTHKLKGNAFFRNFWPQIYEVNSQF